MNDFHDFTKAYAIALHLQSYGYDAKLDKEKALCYIKQPVHDTFILLYFPTWTITKEFIRVQSQRGLIHL